MVYKGDCFEIILSFEFICANCLLLSISRFIFYIAMKCLSSCFTSTTKKQCQVSLKNMGSYSDQVERERGGTCPAPAEHGCGSTSQNFLGR